MKLRVIVFFLGTLMLASTGFAQVRRGTFEFTPFFGEFFGGNFPRGSNALFDDKVDVDDHYTYGGSFGYYLTSAHEFDFRWAHTDTHFVSPGGSLVFGPSGQNLADLTINYYMADWSYNFGHSRAVPYFTMGAGAAVLNPGQRQDVTCSVANPCVEPTSATRFTASIGGGLKVFATPNFGFRFDGRWYETYLNSDSCNTFSHHGGCCCNSNSNWLGNGEVSGGLIFAF